VGRLSEAGERRGGRPGGNLYGGGSGGVEAREARGAPYWAGGLAAGAGRPGGGAGRYRACHYLAGRAVPACGPEVRPKHGLHPRAVPARAQ
jgi:hypothetical protein